MTKNRSSEIFALKMKFAKGKSTFFGNYPGKNKQIFTNFLTRIHDPQISNQIEAAELPYVCMRLSHIIDHYLHSWYAAPESEHFVVMTNHFLKY